MASWVEGDQMGTKITPDFEGRDDGYEPKIIDDEIEK
jgi:hypothetical protein